MESTAGKKLLKQVSLASNQTCQLLQRIAPGANRNHRTHPMVEHATGTVAFFHAMAPVLIANVLTVTELKGEEEGRLTYLWLIILVFLFMLYGLHTWGVSAPRS